MIRNLIVISDTHCGDRLGLCPPEPQPLDMGGTYVVSRFQKSLWQVWEYFWTEWVPMVTRGEPYDLVHNGDAIDGVHHGSTNQISHNIEDQLRIAEKVLLPRISHVKALGGKYYHIRGTEAHVGKSGEYEERLARTLGAVPNKEGQYARFELWKRVGQKARVGKRVVPAPLVHLLHHIGTTGSAAHEASAVNAEYTAVCAESARRGLPAPDFIVRSHRHRSIEVGLDSDRGYAAALVTAGWQGKTPFAWKIPGARISEPQFGGLLIAQGDEEFYTRRYVKTFEREAEE